MYYIWLILALICLGYYLRCALYAGFGSSFIFVWLLGTVFFGILFVCQYLEARQVIVIMPVIKRIFIIVMCIGIGIFTVVEGCIVYSMNKKPPMDCEYIIVLGCQIRGDRITKSLRKRLEAATEYATDNEKVKIIVAGGQGNGENMSEAQAMYNYLVENGINSERISMEDKSTNTDENIRFSLQFIENREAKIGIVTNNFHIFRALLLARAKGLDNIYGISSKSDEVLFINYMVREFIGVTKDFVVGNFYN